MMNIINMIKQMALITVVCALVNNVFALSKQDKAMQQQLLSNYGLNNKYCDCYSDTKDASADDLNQWKIICTTPDNTIISSYSFVNTDEPNLAILLQSEYIEQYGQPFDVKGKLGHIKMLWSKNKDEDTGLYFQAIKGNGNLLTLVGDYKKSLTNRYKGTLLTWD